MKIEGTPQEIAEFMLSATKQEQQPHICKCNVPTSENDVQKLIKIFEDFENSAIVIKGI